MIRSQCVEPRFPRSRFPQQCRPGQVRQIGGTERRLPARDTTHSDLDRNRQFRRRNLLATRSFSRIMRRLSRMRATASVSASGSSVVTSRDPKLVPRAKLLSPPESASQQSKRVCTNSSTQADQSRNASTIGKGRVVNFESCRFDFRAPSRAVILRADVPNRQMSQEFLNRFPSVGSNHSLARFFPAHLQHGTSRFHRSGDPTVGVRSPCSRRKGLAREAFDSRHLCPTLCSLPVGRFPRGWIASSLRYGRFRISGELSACARGSCSAISRETRLLERAKFSDGRGAQEEGSLQVQEKKCAPKNATSAAGVHRILFRTTLEARKPLAESASEGSPQTAVSCFDAGRCAVGD